MSISRKWIPTVFGSQDETAGEKWPRIEHDFPCSLTGEKSIWEGCLIMPSSKHQLAHLKRFDTRQRCEEYIDDNLPSEGFVPMRVKDFWNLVILFEIMES